MESVPNSYSPNFHDACCCWPVAAGEGDGFHLSVKVFIGLEHGFPLFLG